MTNTATATGTPPIGDDVDDTASSTVTLLADPEITVVKTATPISPASEGATTTYSYLVTNTGNVTLTGVTLDDDVEGSLSLVATTLEPG